MRPALLAASLGLLAACNSSPNEQVRKLQQNQKSWEATAQVTAALRKRGAVPEEFARQTLEAAKEELEKNHKKLEQLSQ